MAVVLGMGARAAFALAAVLALASPLPVAAAGGGASDLHADLDGIPIVLTDVGQHFCDRW